MLKEYIEIGYLKKVTDDANIEKLEKSCEDLKKVLTDDKSKIATYTLVGLAPEIKAENSVYTEVRDIISKNWKTFMNSQGDTPKTIIRAVILDALEKLTEDIQIANLIWLASRNIFEYLKIKGKEKKLLYNFIMQLGKNIEEQAAKNFGQSSNNEEINIEFEEVEEFSIDADELATELKAASIHSGLKQEGGENPQYPSHNAITWPKFFSERASKGIANIVNSSIQSYTEEINVRISQLNEFANSIQSPETINNSMQLRNELLWWKEACYSNTLKDTYRGKKDGFLQIILATDFSDFMPVIFPTSANYFLMETNKSLSSIKKKDLTITEMLNLIDKSRGELKQYIQEPEPSDVRISLHSFVTGYINDIYKTEQFKELVGFEPNEKIGFDNFTMWLFHDLQVQKIINS